jgi:2'-5' RNA ligase
MRCGVSVKWVEEENLHLTMRFFGDVEEERIDRIRSAVTDAAADLVPIEAKIEGLGAFPSLKRPRVIWLGISDGRSNVLEMKRVLENALAGAGFPADDKKFSAHITLGRVKDRTARVSVLSSEIATTEFPASEVSVQEISCLRSDLTKTGPVYTKLFSVALGSQG